ncbi:MULTISPECIES: DUF1330 domain-containing protein [Rhizobium/Agrobacterium group]|uniref:DUF1330 domain-containing protein n=1 Tax=Rhizobium/Agrobacterium group TaxID=227290 RepID=UPI001ADB5125|nr:MULTISPECIES: DUF1330 domain-containing protein [Rhizobium/Agrobacterium group]MBO9112526.1 DUF1330 domain-containing protein [Agrobacterium sp. S2/73]QXZ76032.1 DUF1330 domain-containing protein [Agrobacterium sp. S7/73]QYA16957.1 DUF1330 domain-containing protein [Rhizobium sp. AB2/73]UEQ85470.1 DUF1330 domain-containing protein [Rhizobium sp. AB2/73]
MTQSNAGYLVGNYSVTDEASIADYARETLPLLQSFGGKVIVLNRNVIGLEGEPKSVLIIVEFPNIQNAKAFYDSAEYTAVKHLRIGATSGGFLTVTEGFEPH